MSINLLNSVSAFFNHSISYLKETLSHPLIQKAAVAAFSTLGLYAWNSMLDTWIDDSETVIQCKPSYQKSEFYIFNGKIIHYSGIDEDFFWSDRCPDSEICGARPETLCAPYSCSLFEKHADTISQLGALSAASAGILFLAGHRFFKKAFSACSKAYHFLVPEAEQSKQESTWLQSARGAALAPLALTAGLASILAGTAIKSVPPQVFVKAFKAPSYCPLSSSFPLLVPKHLPAPMPLSEKIFKALLSAYLPLGIVPTEEFLFRSLTQHLFLKSLPVYATNKVSSRFASWIEQATAAKVARVVLSSALFSAFHSLNTHFSPGELALQYCNTFGLGLVAGALQETTGRVWASIGLHSMFNLARIPSKLKNC